MPYSSQLLPESGDEKGNVSRLINWSTRKSMNGRIPTLWRKCHGINPKDHGLKRTTQSTAVNLALKKGVKKQFETLLTDRIPFKYHVSTARTCISLQFLSGARRTWRKENWFRIRVFTTQGHRNSTICHS